MNKNVKNATLLFAIFCILTSIAYASTQVFVTIPTTGIVTTPEMATNPSSINWGTMALDSPCIRAIELNNTGALPITNLTMTYTLPTELIGTLTWDLEDESLDVAEIQTAHLNLTLIDAPLDQPFNFNITITGES